MKLHLLLTVLLLACLCAGSTQSQNLFDLLRQAEENDLINGKVFFFVLGSFDSLCVRSPLDTLESGNGKV